MGAPLVVARRRQEPIVSSINSPPRSIAARVAEPRARLLPVDEPVAEAWALLGIPNPLPLIDGLLAATAIVHGLTLVTRNVQDMATAGVPLFDPFTA